ncbi:unnamed protein product [Brugia pahangi]|uniref:Uncharacterized protein n=1 Tax=Brugia pahangi TaxID=6280 RepID=A0A0N4TPL9_BRUPA|nr:unnamed protein product [Brugia pahangi]
MITENLSLHISGTRYRETGSDSRHELITRRTICNKEWTCREDQLSKVLLTSSTVRRKSARQRTVNHSDSKSTLC